MTNNKQQTAVEWFIEKLLDLDYEYAKGLITLAVWSERKKSLIEQAKEMQKEMTVKLYNDYENYLEEAFKHQNGGQAVILSFEEFYEQTYGGGNK
jgi:cyclopropane fatty-acyl-phospholipid synthase-like methyltransferase